MARATATLIAHVRRAIRLSAAHLAREAGISHHTWRSWVLGRRTPNSANLAGLARALETHARSLQQLAQRAHELARAEPINIADSLPLGPPGDKDHKEL